VSPKQLRSQPIANKKIVGGKISLRTVRFRIRKFLCVFNVMPGVYFWRCGYKPCETLCSKKTAGNGCIR
jgi:hypothetical protein